MKRHYYLMIDRMARKTDPGMGFCNAKKVLAFSDLSVLKRVHFERSSFDFSMKRVSRKFAIKKLNRFMNTNDFGFDLIEDYWDYLDYLQDVHFDNFLVLKVKEGR